MTTTPRLHCAGFTYIAVLFAVVIMASGLGVLGEVWRTSLQREQETELLHVGKAYTDAIMLYYEAPGVVRRYPRNLEQLVEDDRFPIARRYLRRLYPDPITGITEWGTVRAPDGGIMGVFSLSHATPLKSVAFRGVRRYSDWKFVYEPAPAVAPRSGSTTRAR